MAVPGPSWNPAKSFPDQRSGFINLNTFAFVAYAVLVTYLSLDTLPPVAVLAIPHMDKVIHMLTYFVFAVLGYRMVATRKGFVAMSAGIAAYSGLMEIAQSLNPDRMTSIADLGANVLGVVTAFMLLNRSAPFRNFVAARD